MISLERIRFLLHTESNRMKLMQWLVLSALLTGAAAQTDTNASYRDRIDAAGERGVSAPGGPCTLGFLSGAECSSNVCRGDFCCEAQVAPGCRQCNSLGKCAECAVGFSLQEGTCSLLSTAFVGDPQVIPTASPSGVSSSASPSMAPSEAPIIATSTEAPTQASGSVPTAAPTGDTAAPSTTPVPSSSQGSSVPSSTTSLIPSAVPSQQPSAVPTVGSVALNETGPTLPPNTPDRLPNEGDPMPVATVVALAVSLVSAAGISIALAVKLTLRLRSKQVD